MSVQNKLTIILNVLKILDKLFDFIISSIENGKNYADSSETISD